MQVTVDARGRIVIPKALRDEVGLMPGSKAEISRDEAGLLLLPAGSTARVVEKDGRLVVTGTTAITDEMIRELLEAGRK